MKRSRTILALAVQLALTPGAWAAGGNFSLDFTAAEPSSYSHATGGGAYDERKVGTDIVESLEGGDFACLDTVTFLTQITVDNGAIGAQSLRIRYEFTAHSTGQQGVALVDNVNGTSAAINSGAIDTGTVDDSGSTATVFSEGISGPPVFTKPSTFTREVDVTDLEAGEKVVLRTDVRIACNGEKPTGNMQARLSSATAIPSNTAVSVGDQTVPFKRVGDIKTPPPPPPK